MYAGTCRFEGPQPANMHTVESADAYKALVAQANAEGRLLVAKFFTTDCWVCKSLHPKIKQLAAANPHILFAKLNGSNPQLVDMFHALGVTKVRALMFVGTGAPCE